VFKKTSACQPCDVNLVLPIMIYLFSFGREDFQNPGFWSRVCLTNMAKLGKEATTIRRVLDSLFRYFDNGHMWSSKHGIACPVLKDLQAVMESSGKYIFLSFIAFAYKSSS